MVKERKKEYYETHKEKYKKYYETHKEEILKKQMERYYEKKEKERLRMEQMKGNEINYRYLKENEKYLVFTTHTMSGKQLGYEVRKRVLVRDEYGKDKWTFTDKDQMEEWIEYGKLIH